MPHSPGGLEWLPGSSSVLVACTYGSTSIVTEGRSIQHVLVLNCVYVVHVWSLLFGAGVVLISAPLAIFRLARARLT